MVTDRNVSAEETVKAVIFDVGGVLVRTHDWSGRRRWEEQLALEPGQAEYLVFNSEMGQKAQRGDIAQTDLWQWLRSHLALDDEQLAGFRQDFWSGDRLDESLVDYIHALRPRYQTAIISNFDDSLRHTLASTYPAARAFDLIVVSAEERVMKPDSRIYRLTLERLGRRPGEAVFVDDSPANVAGARALGMHAVHYKAGMDVPAALAAFGVHPASSAQDSGDFQEK